MAGSRAWTVYCESTCPGNRIEPEYEVEPTAPSDRRRLRLSANGATPVDLLLATLQRYHLRYQTDAKASTWEAFEINCLKPLFLAPRPGLEPGTYGLTEVKLVIFQ